MKTKLTITLLLAILFTGCQKQQPEDPNTVAAQFEKSDDLIEIYLDKLDNPETPKAEQIQILCKDYPAEFKNNYVPVLLKLQPKDYTEAILLSDLNLAMNYYKEKNDIQC